MKCKICNKKLIVFGEVFLHPPSSCIEKDGFEIRLIDELIRDKFKETYGKPKEERKSLKKLLLNYLKRKKEVLLQKK